MSLVVNPGYTPETTKSVSIPDLDYQANFYTDNKSTRAGKTLLNSTSPTDQQERMRWSVDDVNNVYQGTSIDPAYFATSKKGVSILVELEDVIRVTDTDDNKFRIDLPFHIHTVIRVPVSSYITAQHILSAVQRNHSMIYNHTEVSADRINALIRGSLVPKDFTN